MTDTTDMPLPGLTTNALQATVPVLENVPLAEQTYRMRLGSRELAERIRPGQFFMVRKPSVTDPLLGRPFALFDVAVDEDGQPLGVDFGYVVVGKMTEVLRSMSPGETLEVWGPLGNGFPEVTGQHLCCVAGGIGQTPFLSVLREELGLQTYGTQTVGENTAGFSAGSSRQSSDARRLSMLYGVRNAAYLAGVEAFTLPGVDLQLATDDGSAGHQGFVTELLQNVLDGEHPPDQVFCCGPEPMMAAVARICAAANVPCWLSLESPMACGFGACFSCVTRVKMPDGSWDYRRTCVEGPVFRADQLLLE